MVLAPCPEQIFHSLFGVFEAVELFLLKLYELRFDVLAVGFEFRGLFFSFCTCRGRSNGLLWSFISFLKARFRDYDFEKTFKRFLRVIEHQKGEKAKFFDENPST